MRRAIPLNSSSSAESRRVGVRMIEPFMPEIARMDAFSTLDASSDGSPVRRVRPAAVDHAGKDAAGRSPAVGHHTELRQGPARLGGCAGYLLLDGDVTHPCFPKPPERLVPGIVHRLDPSSHVHQLIAGLGEDLARGERLLGIEGLPAPTREQVVCGHAKISRKIGGLLLADASPRSGIESTEAKRQRTAREQQTYDRQKAASRTRYSVVQDDRFIEILKVAGLPEPDELEAVIETLVATYQDGPGDPSIHGNLIFNSDLIDLSTLPPGLLDHKELPLPTATVSRSRADLLALCERMIVRTRNPELIAYVVAGWPGCAASRAEIRQAEPIAIMEALASLDHHADRLWLLSGMSAPMYQAIVTGRFGTALRMLRHKGPPKNFTSESIRSLIARHGLIWCCNDLQLILARGRAGAHNPFGRLLDVQQIELKPERVANDLRRYLALLRLALDLYSTTAEENDPSDPKAMPAALPDDGLVNNLGVRIGHLLGPLVAGLAKDRAALDRLIVKSVECGFMPRHGRSWPSP